ncbi:MAG TPA: hypothetical protein VD865_10815 [Stenotrophomonas sp.]|nr:hypothetical protein [Stenotrophomonas sp.]
MQQQLQAATPARPQIPGTGPGAEATTPAVAAYERALGECSATITMHVTHDTVVVAAVLHMGQHRGASQRWERRRGAGQGWKLVDGPRLWTADEERISTELANFMDGLDFPFALANMLPRRPSVAVSESIAEAAREVGHG